MRTDFLGAEKEKGVFMSLSTDMNQCEIGY